MGVCLDKSIINKQNLELKTFQHFIIVPLFTTGVIYSYNPYKQMVLFIMFVTYLLLITY